MTTVFLLTKVLFASESFDSLDIKEKENKINEAVSKFYGEGRLSNIVSQFTEIDDDQLKISEGERVTFPIVKMNFFRLLKFLK